MNEREILKQINYHGEYNKEVKKNLKNLLKKYHPDHYHGSSETFKKINQIKNKLENNEKLVYEEEKVKKTTHETTDDILWYKKKIDELNKQKDNLLKEKELKQKELKNLQDIYTKEYENEVNNRNEEFDYASIILDLTSKRNFIYTLLIIISFIILTLIFTKIYYLIIIMVILIILLIIKLKDINRLINEQLSDNKKIIKTREKSFANITNINHKINHLYQEIWEIDCEITHLNTQINLYYNHLK